MTNTYKKNMSTFRLTNLWVLINVPGMTKAGQSCWKIRCLGQKQADGTVVSPALKQLREWQKNNEKEYEKLLRAIRYGGSNQVHQNQNLIRQDEKKRGGYEFKNTACKCRLFFFYDRKEEQIIICTNTYWKNKNSPKESKEQDRAFAICAQMKVLYNNEKGQK